MTTDSSPVDSVPKTTLFCPECDHSSRYDGDWTRAKSGETVHYLCPDCHTEVTTRPARTDSRTPSAGRLWRRWTENVRALQSAWLEILHP